MYDVRILRYEGEKKRNEKKPHTQKPNLQPQTHAVQQPKFANLGQNCLY